MASEMNLACEVENLDADVLGILHKVVLSESYKYGGGFTILKELIQNADDARAEEMVLAYYDGSDESFEHPPFRQKGILVYNDGIVEESEQKNDIKAIKSIAKNSKTDNNTIGKFGLGLKSIFHICESFYFFCHSDSGMELKGYLNPFIDAHKKDKWHPDWKESLPQSDIDKLIKKIESSIIGKRNSGITFFFPINPDEKNTVSTVLGGDQLKIDPLHPFNRDDEGNSCLIKNMIVATAILSKTSQGKLHKITYQMDEKNRLVFDFERNQKEVVSCINDDKQEYKYAVEEHCIEETELGKRYLEKIRESNKEDTGKKEDSFKDSKVVFEFIRGNKSESRDGKLNIFHAVNLPLPQSQKNFVYDEKGQEKNALENLEIKSKYNYDLIIHAPFAIDSGRKEFVSSDKIFQDDLKKYDSFERAVSVAPQKYWNAVIYQLVILPNLPKFIKEANDEGIIDDDDIAKIVKQVRKSFSKHGLFCRWIASRYNLFKRFDIETGSNNWYLYENQEEKKLKYVYVYQTEARRNKQLLEGVISDDSCFAIIEPNDADEYLMNYDDGFDEDSFKNILGKFNDDLLGNSQYLKNFIKLNNDCLQKFPGSKIDVDVSPVITRIKEVLYDRGLKGEFGYVGNARTLCDYLKGTYDIPVFYIKNESLDKSRWVQLWSENNEWIILPNSQNSSDDKEANGEFNNDTQTKEFFDWLSSKDQIKDIEKHNILMDIVSERTIKNIPWYKPEFCDLKIVLVRDLEGNEECRSRSELGTEPLFRLDENESIPEILKCYQEFLGNKRIYRITNEEKKLFGIPCETDINNGILKYIRENMALHEQSECSLDVKNKFLGLIFDDNLASVDLRTASRDDVDFYLFLLNGFSRKDACYRPDDGSMGSPWKEILEELKGKEKNIVALSSNKMRVLEKCISRMEREIGRLDWKIEKYNKKSCINLLKKCSDLSFLQQEPFLEYREDIFKEIDEDDDLFCRIPLHLTESGKYISFDPSKNFYNHNKFQFPEEMKDLEPVDILVKREPHSVISEKLHNRFDNSDVQDRIWRGGRAVYDLIDLSEKNHRDPSRSYDWLYEMLKKAQFRIRGESETSKVKKTAWLPLKNGKSASPESVVVITKFKNSVQNELKKLIPSMVVESDVQWSEKWSVEEQIGRIREFIGDDFQKEDFARELIANAKFDDYIHFQSRNLWKSVIEQDGFVENLSTLKVCKILLKEFPEESVWDIYQHLGASCCLDYDNGVEFLNYLSSPSGLLTQECEQLFLDVLKEIVRNEKFDINNIERLPAANGIWKATNQIVKSIYSGENYSDEMEEIPDDVKLKKEFYEVIPGCDTVQSIATVAAEEIRDEEALKIVLNWNCNVNYKRGVLYLLDGMFREKAQLEDGVRHLIDCLVEEFGDVDRSTEINLYSSNQKTNGDVDDIEDSVKALFESLLRLKYGINLDERKNESCDASFKDYADKLVAAIENPSQVTIDGAQKRIQADVFATLRMLNVKHEIFKEFDNEYNDICYYGEKNKNADTLRKELIDEIKCSEDLRNDIFNKVCEKIRQNQYSPNSILFELFQNADDCVEDLVASGHENVIKKFSVTNQGGTLAVVHYGRPINAKCGDDEEKNARFKYDLLNMLSLSSSDKLREDGHTGKFGLG